MFVAMVTCVVCFCHFTCATLCQCGISYGRVSVCRSVCLSVTRRYCIETAEQIKLVFWHRGFPRLILHFIGREFMYPQK